MTTQIEALKLALEALETYHGYMEPLLTVFGGPRVPAEKSTTYKVEKAITAIKEALAQPEQEPVAWAEKDGDGNVLWNKESCFSDDPEWLDNPMPLYTTPPQRKPLDAETRNWIVATCPTPRHIIDTVEKMHGIKGDA